MSVHPEGESRAAPFQPLVSLAITFTSKCITPTTFASSTDCDEQCGTGSSCSRVRHALSHTLMG